jgi:hypothetical protein
MSAVKHLFKWYFLAVQECIINFFGNVAYTVVNGLSYRYMDSNPESCRTSYRLAINLATQFLQLAALLPLPD